MRSRVLILGHNDATQFIDIFNQYTRLFDPARYEVTVAYLTGKPNEATRERTLAEKILFLDVPKSRLKGLKLRAIHQLYKLTRQEKFNIVICHRYKPSYLMLWVSQWVPIKHLVCVMHELGTMQAMGRQWLMTALAKKNTVFAGVSNAVRDDLRASLKNISPLCIQTLYNVIDVDLITPSFIEKDAARELLHLPKDRFIIGNIARLAVNKDQATLINAFATVQAQHPKALLVIMGDGELEPALKKQISALGLEKHVLLLGFVPTAFHYLKAFDAFALSSIQEAFGRVLIEAMLAKCPIVATKVNGIPEVVGDSAFLVNAQDTAALTTAMLQLISLNDASRQALIDRAYQRVCSQFSIPAFHQQFWNVIQ